MTIFTVDGAKEPFLIVQLKRGKKVFAEPDSILAMQDGIEITGTLQGGFLASIGRTLTSDESLFQQTLTAKKDSL